jgi:hypothetical protein
MNHYQILKVTNAGGRKLPVIAFKRNCSKTIRHIEGGHSTNMD